MPRFSSVETILLASVTALAAFLRLYQLDQLPPGFQFDQAFYVFDVLRLLQGQFHIFFAAPGGTEPLYPYLAMPAVAIFGADTPLGLKLTGAILGALTMPVLYGFTRSLFRSTLHATLSTLLAAISFWHIFFNRFGERVTLLTLITILVFWFYWRVLSASPPLARHSIFTGIMLALALYTYPGSRVLPFALALLTVCIVAIDRVHVRARLLGLGITLATAAILCAPLGFNFLQHPDQFLSHTAEVSIFVPHDNVTADVPAALANNALKILGMFFCAGDPGALRNLPARPIFDPLTAILFLAGVIAWLAALFSPRSSARDRRRALFIGAWLGAILAISLVSDDAPNFARTLPAMPAVMILPAWGALAIGRRIANREGAKNTKNAILSLWALGLCGLIIISTWNTYRDYFVVLANDPATYYTFDTDKVETARWINSQSPNHQIFLAPLLATNGTISLLTRNAPLKTFDSRDTMVLPSSTSGKDAVFVFHWEQDKRVQTMLARFGNLGAREVVLGSNGGILLLNVRVPLVNLPDPQNPAPLLTRGGAFLQPQNVERASWANQIELLGYTVNPEGSGGRNLTVDLFVRGLQKMNADYTFSVKVRDNQDRAWGQEDKWLGDNSYATTQWGVGDVIVEKFYVGLHPCASAGEYRISIEAYDPQTMRVLESDHGSSVLLGTTRAGASEGNRLEDLDPEQSVEKDIAPQTRLMGYTLTPTDLQTGDAFSLSLYWRGVINASPQDVSIRLRDASAREHPLARQTIALPTEGRGLCTLFDVRAPSGAAKGAGALLVNDIQIGTVNVR